MNKKLDKVRKLLDNKRYHLHEQYSLDKNEEIYWSLYRIYKGWYTDGSEPIMTSDKNTINELYKFAKKHHIPDLEKSLFNTSFAVLFFAIVLNIVNYFVKMSFLNGVVYGIDLVCMLTFYVRIRISNKELNELILESKALEKMLNEKEE